jgi:hypothetical protein
MCVMVWVASWGKGERSKLFVLEHDFKLKKYRYSANFYIKVLENWVLEHYYNNLIFI